HAIRTRLRPICCAPAFQPCHPSQKSCAPSRRSCRLPLVEQLAKEGHNKVAEKEFFLPLDLPSPRHLHSKTTEEHTDLWSVDNNRPEGETREQRGEEEEHDGSRTVFREHLRLA